MADEARREGVHGVVGVSSDLRNLAGNSEFFFVGSGVIASTNTTSLGYAPIKLLISTSVYSLGTIGSLKAMFKGFVKGEISDLTTLIYDARENAFDRLRMRQQFTPRKS